MPTESLIVTVQINLVLTEIDLSTTAEFTLLVTNIPEPLSFTQLTNEYGGTPPLIVVGIVCLVVPAAAIYGKETDNAGGGLVKVSTGLVLVPV